MLHAANIVPQIGNAGSKSGGGTVSYQITRRLQCRTGKNSPGQSEPRTGRAAYRREILADGRTKLLNPGGVVLRVDPPDRSRRHQPGKNRKLARSHLPVKNLVREGVGYKGKKASLWPDTLHKWCLIGAAVAQEIDGAEWKRAVLEPCPLVTQGQPAFLPSRTE